MQSSNLSNKHKFIADQMLGRLAKWLRLLGFDTAYSKSISDFELLKTAKQEERVLLTRDTKLVDRREVKNHRVIAILIKSDVLDGQLRQVVKSLSIDKSAFFSTSYCAECNIEIEEVPKGQTKPFVPPYIFETHNKFRRCPKCNRYYWKGTHWEKILKKVNGL